MKNLVVITQKVDINDDLLGFFASWLCEFAKHFDNVFVIALGVGTYDLPANVHVYSLGKERNSSRLLRVLRLYTLLFRFIPNSAGVFAHMSPIFALASWPITFLFGKKNILWYLHRSNTFRLRLTARLCDAIVTANKESLTITKGRIIETGHGIDTSLFAVSRTWQENGERPIEIISVGRISPIKNYETLIQAAKYLQEKGIPFHVSIIGRPFSKADMQYLKRLQELTRQLEVEDKIIFWGFVPYSRISYYYKKSDLVVNLAPPGGIDKAVLEGMAAGCIVFTSNTAFSKYFGDYSRDLVFSFNNDDDLTDKISKAYSLSPREKENISNYLVKSVNQNHSLDSLIERISCLY